MRLHTGIPLVDVVDQATRSRMMAGIQGKNTSPELVIRRGLHAVGFRFRIHADQLPGKPDLIFPKYKAVIFVHGCFWHGHTCRYFKIPKTRTEFWVEKIGKNRRRDELQIEALRVLGWRVLIVWECAVRAMKKQQSPLLIGRVAAWLERGGDYLQIEDDEF